MTPDPTPPAGLAGAVDLSSLVQRAEQQRQGSARSGAAAQEGAPGTAGTPSGSTAGGAAPVDGDEQARAQQAAAGAEPIARLADAVVDGDEQTLQQFMQLSQFMPVLVEMHAKWSSEAQALSPVLARLVRAQRGRLVLIRVDLDANPSLGQQPQVLGIIGGRPLQLFAGNPPEEQITQLLSEIMQVAEQQGMRGFVEIEGEDAAADDDETAAAPEPELPPLHREAYEAVDRGDYEAGLAAFDKAIAQNPADDDARAGRAQVALLQRLHGKTLEEIRAAAADAPDDLDAQLDIADLDVSGGHVEDAFDRLLSRFPTLDADGKKRVRERLLDLFLVVGPADPRVAKARARLTNLLF
ncbi:co-chaperone YbbN [Pseudoclavibacter endophyticus]|uniref:Tetratricopeptide repeat protein n=1 Tax=Pseudoclavibacter endophyticus TaxID=1778590 RepID=A0A6H9WPQ7_9MICO|nr:tetratricopeptide repeat protein [Pseudoclavibacter endophyticus]KAB1647905.1 tetratricopeptide repeat protein [Pseudoclavibacter endophyticus]GGA73793.1 co-chaperone YbbN [Pseudoclavibacter endophyticus]